MTEAFHLSQVCRLALSLEKIEMIDIFRLIFIRGGMNEAAFEHIDEYHANEYFRKPNLIRFERIWLTNIDQNFAPVVPGSIFE